MEKLGLRSASEFGGIETNLGLIILNGIGDSDCFGVAQLAGVRVAEAVGGEVGIIGLEFGFDFLYRFGKIIK
ncbi:hypothetical protein G4B88_000749 [Cannabis sativa]|uniref:Uncharacterized protein n=1 Tax=Cannabis sativa TaxID=3483 RepID=A0A7J6I3S0_CANSA|nr:hypothetical protein G4B88_000749 [Cannabis sativa]